MESKQDNVKVWEDTFALVENGIFKDIKVLPSTKLSFIDLSHIDIDILEPSSEDPEGKDLEGGPILEIVNEDTFTCSQRVKRLGYNPLVLNMASDTTPGGGVKRGAHAQEENLFRRSNYYKFLPTSFYPIPDDEVIYSPNVLVIKDNNYKLLTKPFELACIACAAIRNPRVQWVIANEDSDKGKLAITKMYGIKIPMYYYNDDYLLTRDKIRAIFRVAYLYGHDSLVLGALGCGAFHNPPYAVAQIFNEVMAEYKYCFKYFCFAVYSLNDPNYEIFKKNLRL